MRSAGEIKKQLLILRDLKHLPRAHICENSRVSLFQLTQALRLEATEDILRKLDAYLDAKHLHVRKKNSERIYRFEMYDRELYCQYKAKSIHALTFQDMSIHQQDRMLAAMDYRCKRLLSEKLAREGKPVRLPDGLNYWKCRELIEKKQALGVKKRDAGNLLRPSPVGKSRFL